ncbi:hypothetical protein QBC46DRAFT_378508 [Diplogelasinospora grovesii]|uniref:Uncharacterized protein n=1 Tax=Diplogelasinospora grovesii TaxID=303347 RepID=A0AAN6NDR9_9PEZI|nr:hypothetical protein QBC46DRAFT_378508 [Diplogelasinospora grovesii]
MSGSGGFYKFRCKYFYTHDCPNWVWVSHAPCASCLADGRDGLVEERIEMTKSESEELAQEVVRCEKTHDKGREAYASFAARTRRPMCDVCSSSVQSPYFSKPGAWLFRHDVRSTLTSRQVSCLICLLHAGNTRRYVA